MLNKQRKIHYQSSELFVIAKHVNVVNQISSFLMNLWMKDGKIIIKWIIGTIIFASNDKVNTKWIITSFMHLVAECRSMRSPTTEGKKQINVAGTEINQKSLAIDLCSMIIHTRNPLLKILCYLHKFCIHQVRSKTIILCLLEFSICSHEKTWEIFTSNFKKFVHVNIKFRSWNNMLK